MKGGPFVVFKIRFRGIRLVEQTEQKFLRIRMSQRKKRVTIIVGLFYPRSAD